MDNLEFLNALQLAKEHPADLSIYGLNLLVEFIDQVLEKENETESSSELIGFASAQNWNELIFIDPHDISVVTPFHKDRDMTSYTRLIMKNGEKVEVGGSAENIVKFIGKPK